MQIEACQSGITIVGPTKIIFIFIALLGPKVVFILQFLEITIVGPKDTKSN